MDNGFKLLINDRIIWDCEEFTTIIQQPRRRIIDDTRMIPRVLDDGYVYLNGWKFNADSTIYPGANTSEIIEGQKLLDSHAPNLFSKLLEIFFLKSTSE